MINCNHIIGNQKNDNDKIKFKPYLNEFVKVHDPAETFPPEEIKNESSCQCLIICILIPMLIVILMLSHRGRKNTITKI